MQLDNACDEVVKTMPEGEAEVPAEGNTDVVIVMQRACRLVDNSEGSPEIAFLYVKTSDLGTSHGSQDSLFESGRRQTGFTMFR